MSKEVWSKDDENYQNDSLEDLIRDYDLTEGTVVYVGISSHPSASMFIDADNVIEQAQERAYDEYGEYAECFLDGVIEDEKERLNAFLWEWLDKNSDVTFYMVNDTKPYTITAQDIIDAN